MDSLEMLESEKKRFAAMQATHLQAVISHAIAPMLPDQPSLRAQLKGSASARALLIGGA